MNTVAAVLQSEDFKGLVRERWKVSLLLTALMLLIYFGFVFILAFNKSLLALKLGAGLTVGIPIGIGIILAAWLLTALYVLWANRVYDTVVTRLKKGLE